MGAASLSTAVAMQGILIENFGWAFVCLGLLLALTTVMIYLRRKNVAKLTIAEIKPYRAFIGGITTALLITYAILATMALFTLGIMITSESKLNIDLFNQDSIEIVCQPEMVLVRDCYSPVKKIQMWWCCQLMSPAPPAVIGLPKNFPKDFFKWELPSKIWRLLPAAWRISGKIPFISSYAVFSPGRNWEQIRTTIAYNDSNVKIAGHHAGFLTGYDGATHQVLEDIALMRVIPNMKVIVPCDAIEAKKATVAAAKISGPIYIRLAREKTPVFTTEDTPFIPAKAEIFWESKKPQVVIIGCGPILYNALLAAEELEKEKIGTVVLNNHTIKPIDENKIIEMAKKCGAVVTVEEHSIFGGLGSAYQRSLGEKLSDTNGIYRNKRYFWRKRQTRRIIQKIRLGG